MTILGSVTVVGKADMRNMLKGFSKTTKSTKLMNKGFGVLQASLAAVGVAAGTAAIAFREVLAEAQRSRDAQRFAERLGVATDTLQRYHRAAKLFGIDQETLNDGLLEFSKRSAEAAATGTGSLNDALQILNLNVKSFAALNPVEQMKRYSEATKGLSINMQNFLDDEAMGGAADTISGFTQEIIKAAENMEVFSTEANNKQNMLFMKQWTELSIALGKVKRDFIVDITPAASTALSILHGFLPYLSAVSQVNSDLIRKLSTPATHSATSNSLEVLPYQQPFAPGGEAAAIAANTKTMADAMTDPFDF